MDRSSPSASRRVWNHPGSVIFSEKLKALPRVKEGRLLGDKKGMDGLVKEGACT